MTEEQFRRLDERLKQFLAVLWGILAILAIGFIYCVLILTEL